MRSSSTRNHTLPHIYIYIYIYVYDYILYTHIYIDVFIYFESEPDWWALAPRVCAAHPRVVCAAHQVTLAVA